MYSDHSQASSKGATFWLWKCKLESNRIQNTTNTSLPCKSSPHSIAKTHPTRASHRIASRSKLQKVFELSTAYLMADSTSAVQQSMHSISALLVQESHTLQYAKEYSRKVSDLVTAVAMEHVPQRQNHYFLNIGPVMRNDRLAVPHNILSFVAARRVLERVWWYQSQRDSRARASPATHFPSPPSNYHNLFTSLHFTSSNAAQKRMALGVRVAAFTLSALDKTSTCTQLHLLYFWVLKLQRVHPTRTKLCFEDELERFSSCARMHGSRIANITVDITSGNSHVPVTAETLHTLRVGAMRRRRLNWVQAVHSKVFTFEDITPRLIKNECSIRNHALYWSHNTAARFHEIICRRDGLQLSDDLSAKDARRNEITRGGGKGEIPEKTRRPAASPGTIITHENLGVIRPGVGPGSPWWEASRLTAQPPRPQNKKCGRPEERTGFYCVYKEGKSCKETCIAAEGLGSHGLHFGAMTTSLSVLRASLNYEEQGKNRQERPFTWSSKYQFPTNNTYGNALIGLYHIRKTDKKWEGPPWEPRVQGQEVKERYGRH
ncbi:hypothetical protein PR048_007614 [Dryococelus australis]|uniref:Uncharacterized protein n=1 Tax=Dryococelus australis TaxID=614101 RepID=A0ABQ9HV58_9NEOP|nr:hypothetical protein PR048_007614 [Dryococelus australis]